MVRFPYGKGFLELELSADWPVTTVESRLSAYTPQDAPDELVARSLQNPIRTPRLCELAQGKRRVVIIASDHTRPVPSKVIIPPMLAEIRKGNPDADITLLIATGCHRGTTPEELQQKFGDEVALREKIVIHDCDQSPMEHLGRLPSGGMLSINRVAAQADLLLAEGFIEPHLFAGFSGGRKSVLPGVASRDTVLYNHNAEFLADHRARAGVVDGNPVHLDMVAAARMAKLAFICNVVIGSEKQVLYAVSGDLEAAHRQGQQFLLQKSSVKPVPADIVITTNGGYPLDQNIYQAVKGMSTAAEFVRPGGVIIMASQCADGHGGETFYQTVSRQKPLADIERDILSIPRDQTQFDQWQSQICLRVLRHATVIFVSDLADEVIRPLHMLPAHSMDEALRTACTLIGGRTPSVIALPDGISVIAQP